MPSPETPPDGSGTRETLRRNRNAAYFLGAIQFVGALWNFQSRIVDGALLYGSFWFLISRSWFIVLPLVLLEVLGVCRPGPPAFDWFLRLPARCIPVAIATGLIWCARAATHYDKLALTNATRAGTFASLGFLVLACNPDRILERALDFRGEAQIPIVSAFILWPLCAWFAMSEMYWLLSVARLTPNQIVQRWKDRGGDGGGMGPNPDPTPRTR
jgi:hypothetical protein